MWNRRGRDPQQGVAQQRRRGRANGGTAPACSCRAAAATASIVTPAGPCSASSSEDRRPDRRIQFVAATPLIDLRRNACVSYRRSYVRYKKRNRILGGPDDAPRALPAPLSRHRHRAVTQPPASPQAHHHRPPAADRHHAGDAARLVHATSAARCPTAARSSTATSPGIPSTTSAGNWPARRPAAGQPRVRASASSRPSAGDRSTRSTRSTGWRSSTRPASGSSSESPGLSVFQLEHTWSAGSDGAHYVTVMDLGARSALLAPVNRVVCRRIPDDMVRAWVKHNIEEVGQLEYLLPQLKSSGEAEPAQGAQRRDGAPHREHRDAEPVD